MMVGMAMMMEVMMMVMMVVRISMMMMLLLETLILLRFNWCVIWLRWPYPQWSSHILPVVCLYPLPAKVIYLAGDIEGQPCDRLSDGIVLRSITDVVYNGYGVALNQVVKKLQFLG